MLTAEWNLDDALEVRYDEGREKEREEPSGDLHRTKVPNLIKKQANFQKKTRGDAKGERSQRKDTRRCEERKDRKGDTPKRGGDRQE